MRSSITKGKGFLFYADVFWCHSLQWWSFWNCHQYEARIFLFVLNVIDIHNGLDLVYSINRNTTELYFQLLLTLLLYSPFSYINNIEIEVILSIYNIFHSSLQYRLESNLVSSKRRDDINGKKFFITCYDIDNGVFAVQKKSLERLNSLIHIVFYLIRC